MAQAPTGPPAPGQPAAEPPARPLPPGLDLLWGRRERGRRGPRPALSTEAIADAAIGLADAEGLEAASMARVAAVLGRTPMSLYRYVASKDELLQLMWDASARGAEHLVIEGDGWRDRLRRWAVIQRDLLDQHPWITQMPMPAPPTAPNSLHFVERGLQTMDGTGLTDGAKLAILGLISSFTLSEARMAADAARAERAAADGPTGGAAGPPASFEGLLRQVIDERTYPRLHRIAWAPQATPPPTEREQFLFGLDTILDGAQAQVDARGDG